MKCLISLFAVFTSACFGDVILDSTMAYYDYDSWVGTTSADYSTIVTNVDILAIDLPTNGLCATARYVGNDGTREKKLLVFSGANDSLLVEVRLRASTNVIIAQSEIMRRLSGFAVAPLPSVTNGLAGDRCYCKFTTNGFGYVAFARNTVFAEATSYTNAISASDIAVQLDAAILNASTNALGR